MINLGSGARVRQLEEENRRLKDELEKARLSEKRFLDALRVSPMALCHHDRELRYTWLYNPHMGFVQEDVIGKTDWDILHKDLADRMGIIKRRVLETGVGERVEMPAFADDPNTEYFDLAVEALRDAESGEITGLSCTGIDVTQDRLIREAFKASEENLRFMINASPSPIMVTHYEDGSILFYNEAARDVFSLTTEGQAGAHRPNGILDWLGIAQSLKSVLSHGDTVVEKSFEHMLGSSEIHYLTYSACRIVYSGETAVLTTFHDLTAAMKYQKYLEVARDKAEKASHAKSQFLASASHDLRQPLHAMGLLLGVLEDYVTLDEGKDVLWRVNNSLEAMNELFAGILDISKLDARAVELSMVSVSIQELFSTLEEEFLTQALRDGVDLYFVPCTLFVKADKIQLQRMLRNLITNALRYTPQGRVLVGCRRVGQQVKFCILDTGIGISAKDCELIFQEFTQVSNPERDRRKGLGLGLAICQRIAGLMNSKVDVQSRLGKGSVFSFCLDQISPQPLGEMTSQMPREGDLNGAQVLFVEDEVDVRIATQYMLEAWGCVAYGVDSLDSALTLIRKGKIDPEVMIADYRLCDKQTGVDAILGVRQELKKKLPAIIVSGDTGVEIHLQAGLHGLTFLSKPLLPADLRQHLLRTTGR